MPLDGIDVSKWQGQIDWPAVAATTNKYAISRSSLGRYTHDDTFRTNYRGALNNGLVAGAYHVVAGDSSGEEQAANWKAALDTAGFDKGLLVLDVEAWSGTTGIPAATVLANVSYLADWVRNTYQRQPIIYTGVYWRETLAQHANAFGSKLWLAAYVTDPTPYVPKAWTEWAFWQYTSSGSVAGISGNVDRNYYEGTLKQLRRLAGWEWDELATQAEIRAIVREEIAALATVEAANTDRVVAAVDNGVKTVLVGHAEGTNKVTTAIAGAVNDLTLQESASVNLISARVDSALQEAGLREAGNTDRIVSAIEVLSETTETIASNVDSDLFDNFQELKMMLVEVIEKVEAGGATDNTEELKELVTRLHKHLCLPCVTEA